jgi:hypothetical protein
MTLPTNPANQDKRDEEQPQPNSIPKGSFSGGAQLNEPSPAGEFGVDSIPKGS